MDWQKSAEKIFQYPPMTLVGLFFIILGFLGTLLALAGFFYAIFFMAYFILGAVFLIYYLARRKIKIDRGWLAAILVILGFIIIFSGHLSPTIFSGRDQGTLSETAIRLAQNHRLSFSFPAEREFFKIYGSGKALNFPGFFYQKNSQLASQFPVGYPAWLAVFYSLSGLSGLLLANAVSFFIFALSFFALARKYLKFSMALVSLLIALTSFAFSWLFKFTLGENLALALVWFGIYHFVMFLEKNGRFYLAAAIMSFGLLLFTRIEALLFLAAMTLILYFKYKKNLVKIIGQKIILASAAIFLVYVAGIFINYSFYLVLAKGALKFFTGSSNDNASALGSLGFWAEMINVIKVFFIYALSNYLLVGSIAIVYFIAKKKHELLIPFFIVAPTFIYIFDPNISGDHPWMLRRFLFSVIPACIIYTVLFLDRFFSKKIIVYAAAAILLANNLLVFVVLANYIPHQELLAGTQEISRNFKNTDLVLVDRLASGDGWSMVSGPLNFLYGKQAVYFFNPADLDKIDRTKFTDIYFIIPYTNLDFYQSSEILEKIDLVKTYNLKNETLGADLEDTPLSAMLELPMIEKKETGGGIYKLKK